MESIILVLGSYFFPLSSLSEIKFAMRCVMRKPFGLKLSCYTDRLVGLNEYLDLFHRGKLTQKIGVAELNEILCNSMSNSCIKQSYVQGFDCESFTF